MVTLTMVWILELYLCWAHFVSHDNTCPAHFANLALTLNVTPNPKLIWY